MEQILLSVLNTAGNINFQLGGKILLTIFAVFWAVVLYWVWVDSGERTRDTVSRILYVLLAAVLNVIGWIIYLIIRPSQTIQGTYWADLERRYLIYETSELGDCPKCGTQLYPGYVYCPNCHYEIKVKCSDCDVYIDRKSKFCPYCGSQNEPQIIHQEVVLNVDVMNEQIQASKDEVAKVVEEKRTRYSTIESIPTRLGSSIIETAKKIHTGVKEVLKKTETQIEAKKTAPVSKAKHKKVKSSKKKHKR